MGREAGMAKDSFLLDDTLVVLGSCSFVAPKPSVRYVRKEQFIRIALYPTIWWAPGSGSPFMLPHVPHIPILGVEPKDLTC